MRISDWSSDVCSSDLQSPVEAPERARRLEIAIEASLGIQQPVGELGSPSLAASLPRQTKRVAPESDRLHHVATEADLHDCAFVGGEQRSEEHTSELQSLMRISYAVSCLKIHNKQQNNP